MIRMFGALFIVFSVFMVSCVSAPPIITRELEKLDDKEMKEKLGKVDIRMSMVTGDIFVREIDARIKSYQNDKRLPDTDKQKRIGELTEKRYEVGKWYQFIISYDNKQDQQFVKFEMSDARGGQYFKWASTTTMIGTMTMKMGTEKKTITIITQGTLLETKVPITKKHIAPDQAPLHFKVTLFKDNIIQQMVQPQ